MKKKLSMLVAAVLLVMSAAGCGENPVPSGTDSNTANNSSVTEDASSETPVKKDENVNPLTGEYNLKDRAVGKRPVSVMVNNIKKAWPQYGLSSADICYEIVVEGGITRIMAVFADYQSVPKIGSVRSVRHYFLDCSAPLNTIFVHWGGSTPGYDAVKSRGINNIDGMSMSKVSFLRDNQLKKEKGQEFSNFTNAELIQKGIEKKKYNTSGTPNPGFQFDPTGQVTGSVAATDISVKFSGYVTADFDYDSVTGKYLKSEFGQKQIDKNNNQQIAVDNVFVLYADIHLYAGSNKWMDVEYNKGGSGYYISKGTKTDFTWSKSGSNKPFQFKDASGADLKVNPGKSWFCIVSDEQKGNTTIK